LNQYDRALYAYILALCPHWADAEDLTQETRIRLWKQFDKYQPGTDFGAWARSVAYYLVLAHREKAGRSRLRFGLEFYETVAAEVAARPSLVVARQEALVRCMEKLDATKRALIETHYADNLSLRELAEQLGQSYEATRKSVYRTQLILAGCIESELQQKGADE
jgi:RNA polymerase sigma-70 factor, ECF subfamily